MDDPALTPPDVERSYLCPGEIHPIDQALHRARLAAHFPACRACDQRHDLQGLTAVQRAERLEVERHAPAAWQWTKEGLAGTSRGPLDVAAPVRLATALANICWQRQPRERPTILVASDGGWSAVELAPPVCRALQLAGVLAVDVGESTTASLACAVACDGAASAIWLGNATGTPHALAAQVYSAAGRPASSPGSLDDLRQRYTRSEPRSRRRDGALERRSIESTYLAQFDDAFHGLRPLTLVLDTTCQVLVRYWQRLSSKSGCRLLHSCERSRPTAASPNRLLALGQQVVAAGAHLGVWIDGQAECLQIVDERGELVPSTGVHCLLAEAATFAAGTRSAIDRVPLPDAITREESWRRLVESGSAFQSVGSRYWFAQHAAVPDALAALCLLLRGLSQSDRTLSEALDAARAGG